MYEIDAKLLALEEKGTPVQVSLIGCGQMGKDIVAQISKMKGIVCNIVVDLDTATSVDGYRQAGYLGSDIVITDDQAEAEEAIERGKKVATANYKLAIAAKQTQVVIDATGSPEMGARVTLECVFHKRHIVMMNVECDVTIGP
ncbi:MAG TPA: NAD(P)-dependent oxidoreductase, partial [Feifaniaceae bacterium]|nr:NAD(P)-dependent oxidoreductase [Feifaniaceae bacterium]